ncbi:MAG: hypothetical protein ACP5U0_08150, partial [Caldisphaera sp.]
EKYDDKVVITLIDGKRIEFSNADIKIEKKRINFFRSILAFFFFFLIAILIIIYLPPWKIYDLPRDLNFILSLSMFAILAASIYAMYVSADSMRKRDSIVVESKNKKFVYLYIKGKES